MSVCSSTLFAALFCGIALGGALPVAGHGQTSAALAGGVEEQTYPAVWFPIKSLEGKTVDTVLEKLPDGRLRGIATYAAGRRVAVVQNGTEWTYLPSGSLHARRVVVQGKQQGLW